MYTWKAQVIVQAPKAAKMGGGLTMATPNPIKNEAARVEALHKYAILDTEPEQAFDDLVLLASFICKTPIALI